jgi:hypothetical protein
MPGNKPFLDEYTIAFDDVAEGGKITINAAEMQQKMEDLTVALENMQEVDTSLLKKSLGAFKDFAKGVPVEKQDASPPEPSPWDRVPYEEMLVQYPRKSKQEDGYEDHTQNPGWLRYQNIQDLLARYFITIHANYGKVRNWREMCIGITSMDSGTGDHMPMFDYDGKNIKTKVKKDVKQLQSKFKLGDATIYETRKGLHVYFFSDLVSWDTYREMMESVNCCKGFKRASNNHGYSVLRVSAKYTDFDILPYKVVISPHRGASRPGRKAALVQELLRQGQECGTHIASLYPQWAIFREDESPWRVAKRATKRVRKVSKEEFLEKKKAALHAKMKKEHAYKVMYNTPVYSNSTATTTSTWTTSGNNNW